MPDDDPMKALRFAIQLAEAEGFPECAAGLRAILGRLAQPTERATKEQSHLQFYNAFHTWFMQSGCDFWSECDAPEYLAQIAVELMDKEYAAEREAAAVEARRALLEEIEARCSDPGSWPSAIYREVAEEVLDAVRDLASPAPQEETR